MNDDYLDAQDRLSVVKPMISETRLKLHEITDNHANISEGLRKYNEIYGKTEEARCKEYQDLLLKIGDLRVKYNLPEPINVTMSSKPNKLNIAHNKASYISVYDLKIEFDIYEVAEAFEIYHEILSLLPEYSLIYFVNIKESTTLTLKNISLLRVDSKPALIKCKIYSKIRDVVYMKL